MTLNEIKEKITSKKSNDRKRAAKDIGKQKLTQLGDMLYQAYIKEALDKRTWETQVAMITALGIIDYKKALTDIESIVNTNLPHDMITSSASTSYVRLTRKSLNDASPIISLLKAGSISVASGALETLALDQMKPNESEITEILSISLNINKHTDRIGMEYGLIDPRKYIALACYNWDSALTESFLNHCIKTAYNISRFDKPVENIHLIDICKNSLKGKISKGYL